VKEVSKIGKQKMNPVRQKQPKSDNNIDRYSAPLCLVWA